MLHKLLCSICRCPNIRVAVRDKSHPCHKIVNQQNCRQSDRQLPEPWNGDLENAPLLVISSNPSISTEEKYPTEEWKEKERIDFFENRFEGYWTRNLIPLLKNGAYGRKVVAFWSHIHKQAERAYGREARAGKDYCITEAVHCKSEKEKGVVESLNECGEKWMRQILQKSKSQAIMLVGKQAKKWFCCCYKIDDEKKFQYQIDMEGRKRAVLIVPHPNSRKGIKRLDKILTDEELLLLRGLLNG